MTDRYKLYVMGTDAELKQAGVAKRASIFPTQADALVVAAAIRKLGLDNVVSPVGKRKQPATTIYD